MVALIQQSAVPSCLAFIAGFTDWRARSLLALAGRMVKRAAWVSAVLAKVAHSFDDRRCLTLASSSRRCSDAPATLCHMPESAFAATIASAVPLEGKADSLSASSTSLSTPCAQRRIRLVTAVALLLLLLLTLLHWYVDDLRLLSGHLLSLSLTAIASDLLLMLCPTCIVRSSVVAGSASLEVVYLRL